ncbi:hydrogenase expression/formation C-terminal domain-containing protein [Salmonella enterica subsp. enterica serovar Infantis]
MAKAKSTPQHCAIFWHVRCLDALKGPLLDSYEICPLPELVLAAPEDLADSRQRLDEVCRWLETR